MEANDVTLVLVIGLAFAALLVHNYGMRNQINTLLRLLRDTNREYKMFQAATKGDFGTVRTLKPLVAGANGKPFPQGIDEEEEDEVEESPPVGSLLTQRG